MKSVRNFFEILNKSKSGLCVGIDPDFAKILEVSNSRPESEDNFFSPNQKGKVVFNFCFDIMKKTADYAGAFKFNTAFFESFEKGEETLNQLILNSKAHFDHVVNIGDSKNADIGNTNIKYAEKMFRKYGFDAMTTNPYLGEPSGLLSEGDILDGRCIIPVLLTTNSEAKLVQKLKLEDGRYLYEEIGRQISEWSVTANCGVVIGATADGMDFSKACEATGNRFVLIPGVGAQGGSLEMCVNTVLKNNPDRLFLVNSSREIIYSSDPKAQAKKLYDQINMQLPKGDA